MMRKRISLVLYSRLLVCELDGIETCRLVCDDVRACRAVVEAEIVAHAEDVVPEVCERIGPDIRHHHLRDLISRRICKGKDSVTYVWHFG